ncbi:LOW QUALITY PROTEIN: homeobox protein 2-like [Macrobrachium rosenbergii]|uniref:LOW QUALITY PROTEIN: homeobox protein 2-like n=1 Tax=Macrobrachium rosenbergii TaxID=79674 RepID=UPI0034D5ED4F
MPAPREPKQRPREPHGRSRSHASPERRQRRRTHSHSPVRRHARSPTCRHNRGRSPVRHHPARTSRGASQVSSTLATCSTGPTYSSSIYAPHSHRDVEESSVTRLIVDRGSSEDEENRENRRRVRERSETYVDVDEGDLKEEEFHQKICKAAKVVSGFLIAMGLILVFYVIITTILGESTPLDIFDFEYEKEEVLGRETGTGNRDLKIELPNLVFDKTELESADLVTDKPEVGTGELLLPRKDYDGLYDENNDAKIDDSSAFYGDENESGDTSSPDNVTTNKDAEGRSYIAYIPVPLNNEEDEEEEEEEEEESKEDKHSSRTKPFFVPVMIMPGGGMNPSPMSHPNHGPNRALPPLPHPHPNRGGTPRIPIPPLHQRKPSIPIPPIRNIPGIPPNIPKGLPNPQLPQVNRNNGGNHFSGSLPPLPPVQNSGIPGIPGNANIPNFQHNPQGGLINNGVSVQGNENNGHLSMNGNNGGHYQNNGNMNRFLANNGYPSLNGGHNNGFGNNVPNNVNPLNNINNGNLQSGINGFNNKIPNNGNAYRPNNGNSESGGRFSNGNGLSIGSPPNGANRMNLPNNGGVPSDNSSNEIWSSLFEILKRRSGTAAPFSSSGSTGRMNGGSIPGPFSLPTRRESTPNPPPPLLPSDMRLRPRLLPKSRMSGPLPRPFPRYRYRLPPIPPPPGMPIVPRRTPPRPMPKPPKEYQYPKDSTSIQDIIKFMKEREKIQQNGNQGTEVHVSYGPSDSGDLIIGDQNHIIGDNPFGDTLDQYTNSGGPSDIIFGSDPVSGNTVPGGGNNFGGEGNQGNTHITFGGGGVPVHNRGNNFNNGGNYNNGGGNFNNGNNNNYGNNPSNSGNSFNVHNNNGNQGSNNYNSGENNFSNGNNYGTRGNNYNSGENQFSSGGSNYNNGGSNYNGGGNNYNGGGNSYNNGGNYFGGGNKPPSNTRDPSFGKSRPFNIMLDVYPMDVSQSTSGSRPFQTSIFYENKDRFDSGQNQYGGSQSNGGYFGNDGRYSNNNERFAPEEDANKHEIILHLNLFSKTPSKLGTSGRNGGSAGDFSGRAGAVSLEIPLTGQLSPLDIYKALMARARSEKPQAQTQYRPGMEKNPPGERDDVEIELFDVEEGPRLLDAIEQGLRELNKDLPPDKRFRIDGESPSLIDLYEAVNGEAMVTPFSAEEFLVNHNHNATYSHHPNYSNTDEYFYYDYYDFQDDARDKDEKTAQSSTSRSLTNYDPGPHEHEQLPTPCTHKDHDDGK